MPYAAQISRNSPTAFLFVVDQSSSMADKMVSGRSKAGFVADALNRNLASLVIRCTKFEGVRDYFDIGVIGYGAGVGNGLSGALGLQILNPISVSSALPYALRIAESGWMASRAASWKRRLSFQSGSSPRPPPAPRCARRCQGRRRAMPGPARTISPIPERTRTAFPSRRPVSELRYATARASPSMVQLVRARVGPNKEGLAAPRKPRLNGRTLLEHAPHADSRVSFGARLLHWLWHEDSVDLERRRDPSCERVREEADEDASLEVGDADGHG
jgi:hypothetical protein